ncbi:endonuclease/exonuclease/phosphatase family protein [Kineosporiaceae bacterium B12]|nr:endonuclease/exonuclease/phosphatase family protein [Kineococcus rubinsiae]
MVATVVATGVVACGALLATAPQWVGLAGSRPFVWTVPFRLPVALGTAALAGVAGLAGLRFRRVLPAALVLAVAAGTSLAVTLGRGAGAGELPPAAPGDVTVLAANVFVAAADPAAVAALALRDNADAVSLPESTQAYADDVAARIEAGGGARMQVFFAADRGDGRGTYGTALLVSEALGTYRPTGELANGFKAVVTAAPVSGRGPVLAAAHTAAPVTALLPQWRRETAAVAAWCAATPGALLAGDLNATLDHPGLRLSGSCVDAGRETGTGARGTWPARVPAALGATIDHALADGDAWRAVGSRVEALRGSDHRALVTRWRPVG